MKKEKLEDLIPTINTKIYLDFYKRLTKIKIPSAQDNVMLEAFEKAGSIRKILEKLRQINCSNKNDIEEIYSHIIRAIVKKQGKEKTLSTIVGIMTRKRGSFKPDYALQFLIYALVYDLKLYTGTPHYEVIATFLSKHLTENIFTYDDVRKRYKEIKPNDIKDILPALELLISNYPNPYFSSLPKNYRGFLNLLDK